jgi:hypothetical protein
LRSQHRLGYIPCQINNSHEYNICDWDPFRMRCNVPTCKHNMSTGQSFRWFAQLVVNGDVPEQAVGLGVQRQVDGPPPSPLRDYQQTTDMAAIEAEVQGEVVNIVQFTKDTGILKRKRDDMGHGRRVKFSKTHADDTPAIATKSRTIQGIPRQHLVKIPGHHPRWYHSTNIAPDGNCMFSAFAVGLGDGTSTGTSLRREAIDWMREHDEDYMWTLERGKYPTQQAAFHRYLGRMSMDGTWGDENVLSALCRVKRAQVTVVKVRPDGTEVPPITYGSRVGDWVEKRFMLYLSGHHYENLYEDE